MQVLLFVSLCIVTQLAACALSDGWVAEVRREKGEPRLETRFEKLNFLWDLLWVCGGGFVHFRKFKNAAKEFAE
ncbi:hypothetical protein BC830DRAFT_1134085 [Chytriomyces sp. MP71]|nr:hypothetical protein BC830DRAFT_1134085 [Chytriomyces sp. MP71]